MIKSIIQKIMIKEFSKYINGIEYNKLTVELLGGYFSIQNISLNHDFFNQLETPLKITYSHIGKLSIQAPITKLSSVPVSCTIEDVYVIAEHKRGGIKISEVSKEELLRKYIKQTFQAFVDKIKDSKKQQGMLDRLGKKIIDNLKMQIKNIHVRFEESNPNHTYAFGVALKSLNFGTTDKNWKPVFVERENGREEEPIFKCMTIDNFKVYWQSIPKSKAKQLLFLGMNDHLKVQKMKRFVTDDSDSILNISSTARLKINATSSLCLPLFELSIDLDPIHIQFSKQKVIQILDFTTTCIKFNEALLKTLLDKALKKITAEQQKKYRPICSKLVQLSISKQKQKFIQVQGSRQMFQHIAIQHLYELSLPFIKDKVQQQRQKELKKEKKSWFSNTEVPLTPEEKKELQRVINELVEDSVGKGRPPQSTFIRLGLTLKQISFHFYNEDDNKLKEIELSIQQIECVLQKTHNNSFLSIDNQIKRIVADILVEEDRVKKKIHLMENICSAESQSLVQFRYKRCVSLQKKTTVNHFSDLCLRKTLFTYKKQYWKMFNEFFSLPEINQQVQNEAISKIQNFSKDNAGQQEQEREVENHYIANLNLNSPTFILPLSSSTFWCLDLGKIDMRSQNAENKIIYPFKLSQLNMRYITNKEGNMIQVLKGEKFFPIIKDINLEVTVTTVIGSNNIDFAIMLSKIELNATKQQFVNLMNVKKFLVGQEKDQIKAYKQNVKNKEELVLKSRIAGKVRKRDKYFHHWIQFYCLLTNNSLYFYPSEKDIVPETIVPLRGFKLNSNRQGQFILELSSNSQAYYLQMQSQAHLSDWQREIAINLDELKDLNTLIMGQKEGKRSKQNLVNIRLQLKEMNWNYLNEKGEVFLKIQLKRVELRLTQQQDKLSTTFNIDQILIVDQVFTYHNPKYQHLFQASCLSLSILKSKEALTKITPTSIKIATQNLYVNWKPDALLLIIESIKQFLNIKPIIINKDRGKQQVIEQIVNDESFKERNKRYDKSASKESIKNSRASYLTPNQKDDQIYLKLQIVINQLQMNFIHRQTHMPMLVLQSQGLRTTYIGGKIQKLVEGSIKTCNLYDISGYPQKEYNINVDYEPYCLLKKRDNGVQFVKFSYSSYDPEHIANQERVDSFLHLTFSPLTLYYFQQVFMRLIDYFLIQIVLLLNHSEVITVNEDILHQLMSNSSLKSEKPKNFLDEQFESVVQKFFAPFFMDYCFQFMAPEIVLSPTKQSQSYFTVTLQKMSVTNAALKSTRRFQNIKYAFVDNLYEQLITVRGTHGVINAINGKFITRLVEKPFDLELVVNRMLFEDEINYITPQIMGYDRSFKIQNTITAIHITEISKFIYQNIVRLPNFNLSFEDQQNQLFIHNYKITKTLSPKPIHYTLKIEHISAIAKHSLDEVKEMELKLWSLEVGKFELLMRRDEKLNIVVEIGFLHADAWVYQYQNLADVTKFAFKNLVSIHNKHNTKSYVIIKMPNTGIMDIQSCLQLCQINLSFKTLPLIADWVQPQDSAFAVSKKEDRMIKFLIRMARVVVKLQEKNMFGQSIKMAGQLTIEMTRKQGYSQNYLRQAYSSNQIDHNYLEKLSQFMSLQVYVGLQVFIKSMSMERKMLEKVKLILKEDYYYKIRNNRFRQTVRRKLQISQLKGSLSVDDIILCKSVLTSKAEGEAYEKEFRDKLKECFVVTESELNASIYSELKREQKLLQQFVFKVETITFYLIHKQNNQYLPFFRIRTNKISIIQFVNSMNQVYSGELDIEAYYFNNQIFRWEPFLQSIPLKLTYTNNTLEYQQNIDIDCNKDVYLNVSCEMAVSLKKWVALMQSQVEQYSKGKYIAEEGQQFHSRYVIQNLTGYPIEIYDDTHKSQLFIMHQQRINYSTKNLQDTFYEENQIKQCLSFLIHHPNYEFLEVTNLSLEGRKSFTIKLYDARGKKLQDHCQIYLENRIDGMKKIISVRSKKLISDYSQNMLVQTYYPFDADPNIVFKEGIHRGMKANFYTKTRNERFTYEGMGGNLVIRKTYLVYNYTVIPLEVCSNIVIPGEFVGIDGRLTIQGVPFKQSFLKVVFNEHKQQYYIYSISYIVDFTGLNFLFDSEHNIKKLYSHQFKQKGKIVRIYLLPDINFQFAVKYGNNSPPQKLTAKLARQTFSITNGNATYSYACFSRLQSFCKNNIKDFKKIIEITNAYQLVNDTTQNLVVRQVGSAEKQKIRLKAGQNIGFHWSNKFMQELIVVSIEDGEQWLQSASLPINQNIDTFIIRKKKEPSRFRIYSIEIQQSDNLTFIHILNADTKYQISNQLDNISINLYQNAIFQNSNCQFLTQINDPSLFTFQIPPNTNTYFGFQLPKHSHQLTIHFQTPNKQTYLTTIDEDIQKNVLEKNIEIFQGKSQIGIKLCFNKKNKTLKFYSKKRKEIFKKEEMQLKVRMKSVSLSLIGSHQERRKQLINGNCSLINLLVVANKEFSEVNFTIQKVRIQNTIKPQPYFISLFSQEDSDNKTALKFALRKSTFNPNLVYYIGFSLRKACLTVTSQELQILQQNITTILQKVNAKSDTNFLLNWQNIFKPSAIIKRSKLYFAEAELHPLKLIMTYKHVNNWGGALLKALSINNCKITVNGKKIKDFQAQGLLDFFTIMGKYFKEQFRNQIFSMIGSLALLGSPLNLASKIGCGFQNLIQLPADGFEDDGVLGIGKGLALGAGSLVSNTVEGAFGSVESITGAIGQGISGLASYDKDFEKTRQEIKNQRADHIGSGLLSGGKSIANGLFTGITGLITEPVKGAQKEGLGGFLMGGLKGITGLIVKPVSGVIDATSKTAEGIKNTTNVFSKETKQLKKRKYNPRPFYGYYRQIRPYDPVLAEWNKLVGLYSAKYSCLSWCNIFPMKGKELVAVSYEYLLVVDRKQCQVKNSYESSEIVSMSQEQQRKVIIIVKNSSFQKEKLELEPLQFQPFYAELRRVFNHYKSNYEIGVDRKMTAK